MRSVAAIHTQHGAPLAVDEIEIPDPRPDQVIVKLFSSGICHSQLHQMRNPATETPASLGHEGAGVVTHVGSDVTHVKEGDHAIVTWVPRTPLRGRHPGPPTGVTYREEPVNGAVYTWGRDVLTSEQLVVPIPKSAPTDLASIVGCAVLTGAGAVMHTANVRPGDSVAIIGVGGVGISAVHMASLLNAYPLIAIDLDDEKLEYARRMGATHTVNASNVDPIEAVLEISGGGVDYAFDAIGLQITNEQILPMTRGGGSGADNHGGMAVLIGVPGERMTINPRLFFSGQRQYRGSLGATRPEEDFPMYLRWHEEGKFRLDEMVTRRYRIEEINEACDDLTSGLITGRAIIDYT
ncbi:MAG: zinc-binding dehydrogenase [Dehalococcoidia bacterium]|jgi:Zn-dependent alcohol dehydrogenase|nr:zinc-binding dehydrogenase [Dehalococcoidia bacterium]